ncbi:hypothetical protein QE152_g35079 [Popillia japonica]|uniref:Uncharacterized protein n=1 Tax=Popillia japonica TaxID=7064 RepID=A0AAW1IRR2_POPJA
MPLTQSQIIDIKALFKECVKDIIHSNKFIESVTVLVAKSIGEKIDSALKTYSKRWEELKKENKMLVNKIDNMQQYFRRNIIRIFGVPEKENEIVEEIVISLCREKLDIDIPPANIDRTHRLGSLQTRRNNKRAIIIKFTNSNCKYTVLRNRYKLRGTGIVIVEYLTKSRRDLYIQGDTTTVRNKKYLHILWMVQYTYVKVGDKKHKVNSLQD